MNDRFEFRAFGCNSKKMYYYYNFPEEKRHLFHWALFGDNRLLGDGIWVIMQSTGLKDKNGKLIFEGDIVKTKRTNPVEKHMGVVQYRFCSFIVAYIKLGKYREGGFSLTKDTTDFIELEVIGNIYENKELLND